MFDMEEGYFTQNKAIKCISYRLSMPRLKFLSVVFGQCSLASVPYLVPYLLLLTSVMFLLSLLLLLNVLVLTSS
jgi:hypothetical protein